MSDRPTHLARIAVLVAASVFAAPLSGQAPGEATDVTYLEVAP